MTRRRIHPLVPLVVWLGMSFACALFALAAVLAQTADHERQLDAAHAEGMRLGQQLCQGYRQELQRAPASLPAPRKGGLL